MTITYIGLGSNLKTPTTQIQRALDALDHLPCTLLQRASDCYQSKPLGNMAQPDYINAVAALVTSLSAYELLNACQHIEAQQGRKRPAPRWAARSLDLDILLYGAHTLATSELHIPHPQLAYRHFVLYPLYTIAPALQLPGPYSLSELLSRHSMDTLMSVKQY